MDLTLTEDQELIASTARELLEARKETAGARAVRDDPAGYSAALWKEMVELGWTGLPFAEEHGGLGAGYLEACLVFEQLGYALVPSPLLTTVACCGLPIARFGTAEQRERWLGAISRGHVLACAPLPWDRPGDGPVATADGDGFRLDGTARLVPYAGAAGDLLVAAWTDGGGGGGGGGGRSDSSGEARAFLVDATDPGVTLRPTETVGADRPQDVGFADVRVPADRVVGTDGAAPEAISAFGAAAVCAEMTGAAQRVLDMTVEYATTREQFGTSIGTFQAVQHHCADMAIDVLGSRFIAYEAVWRLSAGWEAVQEVSMAKAWVSEAYQRVCALGHQVHGAIGFTEEHDLHLFTRHAMTSALAFGDDDMHLERLATGLGLDLPDRAGG
ncbi:MULTISPECIES: acyl-CoA dehydrogenase family protein [Thermomonosporaceae]|uniref:acyl-CoA dehydrogenase family protein n=1 Tax=Thermomonosporaceae TaxID=2012 RepID=UPI00255B3A3E|nr:MULTISPECIES: acyl-CoA dehydrogenase family protein [Thermomonosporaceae]MDL4772363.1 acyl-CoA dehydrogenase family protein [Actinomadura xylanilytica]